VGVREEDLPQAGGADEVGHGDLHVAVDDRDGIRREAVAGGVVAATRAHVVLPEVGRAGDDTVAQQAAGQRGATVPAGVVDSVELAVDQGDQHRAVLALEPYGAALGHLVLREAKRATHEGNWITTALDSVKNSSE
jgi:hypothetical protein